MECRALVATRSRHKLEEVRTILGGSLRIHGEVHELIDLVTAGIAPRPEEEDVEAFDTFRENALAKARYFFRLTGMPTIADDSGIVVHALAGEPGVRSKRLSGRSDLSGQALDEANNALLLDRLRDVPDERRGAHYVCAAALVGSGGGSVIGIGTCRGRILREPAGTGGFGYDPLFLIPDFGRSFGELPADVKHSVSHRGRAFRALAAYG
ncbi:MAG: non-canonical purine NTP pyrophosphatase [Candidatus Cloacimonetes bacterium]|nr:non-canonical purine NTP pyrophosphatase [Candidatus Cloacimonadota bacterium]